MIEYKIRRQSYIIFLIGLIATLFTGEIRYPAGFMIGYLISLLAFMMTARVTDLLLDNKSNTKILTVCLFIGQLFIYSAGLLIGLLLMDYVSYITVFIAYFVIKMTIYWDAFKERRKIE